MKSQLIPILFYHSIDTVPAAGRYRRYTVSPEQFELQMAHIRDAGYRSFTVTGLLAAHARGCLPDRSVVVTIDDGLADFWTNAWPIMRRYGVTGTLYVVTGCIGGSAEWINVPRDQLRPMLTWRQLRELQRDGLELGAHTHTHRALDLLPAAAAREELARCKGMLDAELDLPVESFAYPYGKLTRRSKAQVQEAGFTSAAAVRHGLAELAADPYALARIEVRPETTPERFARWLAGHDLRPARPIHSFGGECRRLVRLVRRQLARVAICPGLSAGAMERITTSWPG